MPSLSEKDWANIKAGMDAIRKIESFTSGIHDVNQFYNNELVFDATLMNFVVIGEVVGRISQELQLQHAEIPWAKIKSFRNIIAHQYFGIDAEEGWQVIQRDLPFLKDQFNQMLSDN
jgi:uncharacterized protein with HEPN domain